MDSEGQSNKSKNGWFTKCSKPTEEDLIFIVQLIVILLVITVSLINLSIHNGDSHLWTALLSCAIGWILPNPKIKKHKIVKFDSNSCSICGTINQFES